MAALSGITVETEKVEIQSGNAIVIPFNHSTISANQPLLPSYDFYHPTTFAILPL